MNPDVLEQVQQFFSRYPVRTYASGQVLLYPGDDVPNVYLIEKGTIRQYDITKKGTEVVINMFQSPAMVPAWLALQQEKSTYFFEVVSEVTARIAPADAFVAFLHENSTVTLDLLNRVYRGLDGMQRRVLYLMAGSIRARLLFELVYECRRFGQRLSDGSIVLDIHEGELANRTGLTRETVSRHLQKLDHGSILQATHKGIVVHDILALEVLLEEEGL